MRTPLFDHAENLAQAWKMLRQDWQATGEVWQDKVRDEFEKEYWNELALYSRTTYKAMQNLAEVIAMAQQSTK